MKLIAILLCLGLVGCSQKPKEKIFVYAVSYSFWQKAEKDNYQWYQADVLQKKGDMWFINIEGYREWIDIKDPKIKWRNQ